MQSVALHYITLHYILYVRYITVQYSTLPYIASHYITLRVIATHYITQKSWIHTHTHIHTHIYAYIPTSHYITLHYITLHCITLHYITYIQTLHTYMHTYICTCVRIGSEAFDLVRRLGRVRSLRAPAALRRSAAVAWQRRWWGLLGVALQRAVVSTLLGGAWLSLPACCGCGAGPRRRPRPRGRFDEATRPFQFALQARAGTYCLATMLRVAVELDPEATVVSLDGRSAYDCVSRAAFLRKLEEVAPALLPFVRASTPGSLFTCGGTAKAFATESRGRAVSKGTRWPRRSMPWHSTTA